MADWKDFAWPVEQARQAWIASGTDADKARFGAAQRAYHARYDCSVCDTRGICDCTFDSTSPPEVAEHRADASEPTTHQRFDHSQELQPMKTYAQHLTDCGDTREAQHRFHADSFESRRPTTVASLRSDSVDDAEAAMRLRGLIAHARTPEEVKAVQHRLATQASQQADRRNHLASVRADAAGPKCKECGDFLTDDDVSETCAMCTAGRAERGLRTRSLSGWRKPLQASKSRMSDPDNGGGAAA